MAGKHLCWGLLQTGALQLYLNETQAQVPSYEICLVSQNSYLQYIYEKLFVVFLKFYFFLCEELEDNEDQRFNNYVNVTQFKKNTAKFHVMWKDILFAWSNSVWSFVQEKCL